MNLELSNSHRCYLPGFAVLMGLSLCLVVTAASQTKDAAQPSLYPAGQISGHVYRSDTGEPIPKAQVKLSGQDERTAEAIGGERIVRTSADGTFVFSDLPAGGYQLEVWRNGFSEFSWPQTEQDDARLRSETTVSLKPAQKLDNLVLHLYPAGVISGQVSDEDQDPVPGLEVYALVVTFLRGGQKRVSAAGRAVTDDLGNFGLPDLPPGPYYVKAGGLIGREMEAVGVKQGPAGGVQYRATYYPGTQSLDEAQVLKVSPEGGANDIHFTVPTERTYKITGKIVPGTASERKRVDQIDCKARDAAGYAFENGPGSAQTKPDGSFEISRVPPGEYTLSALSINQGVQTEVGFALAHVVDSDVRADIEFGRANEVRGNVDAPQGLSLVGKQITLETFGPGFYLLHQAAIDRNGRFVITNIPPGDYTFTVMGADEQDSTYVKKALCNSRDYASTVFTLALGTTLDCDVTLANDMGVVRGKVKNGDDPSPKMVAILIPESRELRRIPLYTLTARTNSAGDYRIPGVIPGDYLLFAVPPTRDHAYFALDFAESHTVGAERISVSPGATKVVDLKLLKPE